MPSLAGSPGLSHGFSTTHENPNPDPEQKNRQKTNPNQPNTNPGPEKEARTVTTCRKRLHLPSRPSEPTTGPSQKDHDEPGPDLPTNFLKKLSQAGHVPGLKR